MSSKSGAGRGVKGGTTRGASKLKVDGLAGSISPGGTTTIDVSVSRRSSEAAKEIVTTKGKSHGKVNRKAKGAENEQKSGKGDDEEEDVRKWKEQLRREREHEDPRLREAEEAAARAAAESKFDEGKATHGETKPEAYETAPAKSFKGDFDWNSRDVSEERGLAEANEKLTRRLAAAEGKVQRLTDEVEALRAGAKYVRCLLLVFRLCAFGTVWQSLLTAITFVLPRSLVTAETPPPRTKSMLATGR